MLRWSIEVVTVSFIPVSQLAETGGINHTLPNCQRTKAAERLCVVLQRFAARPDQLILRVFRRLSTKPRLFLGLFSEIALGSLPCGTGPDQLPVEPFQTCWRGNRPAKHMAFIAERLVSHVPCESSRSPVGFSRKSSRAMGNLGNSGEFGEWPVLSTRCGAKNNTRNARRCPPEILRKTEGHTLQTAARATSNAQTATIAPVTQSGISVSSLASRVSVPR